MTVVRSCIECRTEGSQDDFLRVVLGPDQRPAIDFSGRLPGRGAYLCWTRGCIEGGSKKAKLGRALRSEPSNVAADWALKSVRFHLDKRILELCGLLQKSGQLRSGAHTVAMALDKGWGVAALLTSDAGADGAEQIRRKCQRQGLPVWELPLTSEEFGQAVGKGVRSIATVGSGRLASELERALQRSRGLL